MIGYVFAEKGYKENVIAAYQVLKDLSLLQEKPSPINEQPEYLQAKDIKDMTTK